MPLTRLVGLFQKDTLRGTSSASSGSHQYLPMLTQGCPLEHDIKPLLVDLSSVYRKILNAHSDPRDNQNSHAVLVEKFGRILTTVSSLSRRQTYKSAKKTQPSSEDAVRSLLLNQNAVSRNLRDRARELDRRSNSDTIASLKEAYATYMEVQSDVISNLKPRKSKHV